MKVSATQIRQNSALLQNAIKEDIFVTRRDRPFVVIVEHEKYRKMQEKLQRLEEERRADDLRNAWLESAKESAAVMDAGDEELYAAVNEQGRQILDRDR